MTLLALETSGDTAKQACDLRAQLRLMAWLSPAFPIGGFAYSGGLEHAVADRLVTDAAGLKIWVDTAIRQGSAWNDAVLLVEAHRCFEDAVALATCAELGLALAGSAERYAETSALGLGFVEAARAWPCPVFERLPVTLPYPVAVGALAAAHDIAADKTVAAYLSAFAGQCVSAGIRLSVIGQRHGVSLLAELETLVAETALRAGASSLDDLGSATILGEISQLRHETQPVRLFRS